MPVLSRHILFLLLFLGNAGLGIEPAKGQNRDEACRVLSPGEFLDDPRLKSQRTLNDKVHPWSPPKGKAAWEKQAEEIRTRILVSAGLWPMWPREELQPVIHAKIDQGEYTVEKVYFASLPGHYVSGNLYRPKGISGKTAAVLSPHGHWKEGRFQDAGAEEAQAQIKQGAERHLSGARYPQQARMVQLAKLGCVVFHYDMVGMADSRAIGHGGGFNDVEAELRLQNSFGLQTFNSIRALDFLLSLPEVDPQRVGVTGESGGGTQTFILGAIDPRPAAAFPAVMVSSNMQGGCTCENADYLRIGVNNIAFAALFSPRPLAMTGANDWTIDIETQGLPELKRVYGFYDAESQVNAKCFPQFGHNYNQPAREMMYDWFNTHLRLGKTDPVSEQDFQPVEPKNLSVFDADHPRPDDERNPRELRKYLTETAERQFEELIPTDKTKADQYRKIVGNAAKVLLDAGEVKPGFVHQAAASKNYLSSGEIIHKGLIVRNDDQARIPYIALESDSFNGIGTIWIDGSGKSHLLNKDGTPQPHVKKLLANGNAVASVDLLLTGESKRQDGSENYLDVTEDYAGKTFAYNRPLLAQRVRDTVASIAVVLAEPNVTKVQLVGTGDAGPIVLLAATQLRGMVHEVVVNLSENHPSRVTKTSDPMFLPGIVKYGGLGGLAALAAPTELTIAGSDHLSNSELRPLQAFQTLENWKLSLVPDQLSDEQITERLLK